jgi:hypothetical protein
VGAWVGCAVGPYSSRQPLHSAQVWRKLLMLTTTAVHTYQMSAI